MRKEFRVCPLNNNQPCMGKLCALTTHESTYGRRSLQIVSKNTYYRWWKCTISECEVENDADA